MIISFSVSNYRSFAGEQTLNLVASNRYAGHHDEHALAIPDTQESRVLRLGVLYGANGSGKSNLFRALKYLRESVIKSRTKGQGTGREIFRLATGMAAEPSGFDLQFIAGARNYRYGIVVDDELVVEEWLVWLTGKSEKVIFERTTDPSGTVTVSFGADIKPTSRLAALAVVGGLGNQTFLATVRANLEEQEMDQPLREVLAWFEENLILIAPDSKFWGLHQMLSHRQGFQEFASRFLQSASTGVERLHIPSPQSTRCGASGDWAADKGWRGMRARPWQSPPRWRIQRIPH